MLALVHRWVIAGERSRRTNDDRADHTRALREMIRAGRLKKVFTIACSVEEINREGPIAFIETTTLEDSQIFEEDLNRCFLLHADETADQSRRVIEGIARAAASTTDHSEIQEQTCLTHFAMQLSLKRVRTTVPFAPRIASCMPAGFPESRRAFTLFLGLVKAVALLHQYQRIEAPVHGTCIEATLDDYAMARELALAPLGPSATFLPTADDLLAAYATAVQTATAHNEQC